MIITKIEPLGKGRQRIFLDGEIAFVLYRGEVSSLALKEGMELPDTRYQEIVGDILVKRARLRCMNLLKSMDKTEWQLRTKLRQGDYPPSVIDDAIAYVKSFHYVDDVRYARNYIESRSSSRSIRQITQELRSKGISEEDMEQAFGQADTQTEEQAILKLTEKKHMNLEHPTREELKKYYAFFLRKGFSYGAVRRVLQKTTGSFWEKEEF